MSQVHDQLKEIPPEEDPGAPKMVPRPKLYEVKAAPVVVPKATSKKQKQMLYVGSAVCVILILGLLLRKKLSSSTQDAVIPVAEQSTSEKVETFVLTGRWAEAIPLLEKAIVVEPKNTNILTLLALARKKTADLSGAKELLEKAILLDPKNEVAHNNLGLVFAAQGFWDLALKSYSNALAIRPIYPEADLNAAAAYEATEKWREAILSYEHFLANEKSQVDLRKTIEIRMRRLNSFSVNSVKRPRKDGEQI